ncbi:MAG: helix-turn-helix transcriptional regulator [Clostridia bacterium]|nr:helix-turn-helix transcriptional regulator [Clostridia bacterium]
MKFSSIFRSLLSEQGFTQQSIANKLNTTQQTVSRWINGQNEPDLKMLNSLADIFNCSVDYLLGREDDFGVIAGNSNLALTSNESEMLSYFKLLSADLQREAIGFVKALAL